MAEPNIWVNQDGDPSNTIWNVNGTVTISPSPASLNQGFVISQTSPASGSFAGPISFNTINVVDQGGVTVIGEGTAGGNDDYGLSNGNMVGLRVNYSSAGGALRGALLASYRATTNFAGSYYGSVGSIYTNQSGANPLLWGHIGVAQIGPAGQAALMIGIEGEVAVFGAGTVAQRIAVNANSQGPNQAGTALDVAFAVSAGSALGVAAPFKKMFGITTVLGGQAPIDAAGDIFWADSPITIANVFNSSNWTLTGNFADFPNFGIKGATGQAAFGAPIAGIPANYGLWVTGTSKGSIGLGVSTNTATGASFLDIRSSTLSSEVVLLANEAARTTVRYGLTLGNYTELSSFLGNGLIIGTNNNTPMIFGTNNTFAGKITGGQQWAFGANVNPIAGPILSLNQNTATPTVAVDNTPALQIVGASNGFAGLESDAFGTGQSVWTMRSAFGTAAAPTQVNAAAVVGTHAYRALDDTGAYRTIAGIDAASIGAVSSTDWGGYVRIRTGTAGSAALVERVRIQRGVAIGSTVDPGSGVALLNPQTFSALLAASSTIKGAMACVSDSNTAVWGATIAGGGANNVLAFCNGTNWTVFGK